MDALVVRLEAISNASEMLRGACKTTYANSEALISMRRQLESADSMQGPAQRLAQTIREIDAESYQLRRMAQALDAAETSYSACEDRVILAFEENGRVYVKVGLKLNDLSAIGTEMSDITIV